MSDRIGFDSLRAAAHALRGAETTPINEQVNFVSDALLQGRRVKRVAEEGDAVPAEVYNVLENIAIQVEKAKLCVIDLEEKDLPYESIKNDLEILEDFTKKVITHYKVENSNLAKDVIVILEKAKDEASSIIKLSELFQRIKTVEARYRTDPQMSPHEYKDELSAVSDTLISLEEKISIQQVKNESLLKERFFQVKTELNAANELASMEWHPGVMGGSALSLLHESAEKIQQVKSFEELQKAVEMATQAREAIRHSSKHYQESGLFYEKLIQEIVANTVNKKIRELEEEIRLMSAGSSKTSDTETETAKFVDAIKGQKEKLVDYHKLAKEWGGQHQEELEERIALIFESINRQASTMHKKLLEGLKKNMGDQKTNAKMSELATRILFVAEIGKDDIKPETIFSNNLLTNPE